MRKWWRQITAGLSLACGVTALVAGPAMAAESTDRFDNFRMRQGVPTQLKQIAAMDNVDVFLPDHGDVGTREDVLDEAKMLTDVQAGVKAAIAAGMSREEIVKTLRFPQFANRRNYDRIDVFLEALYHLYTTGKPLFPYP